LTLAVGGESGMEVGVRVHGLPMVADAPVGMLDRRC
jgi:hypothetical protein